MSVEMVRPGQHRAAGTQALRRDNHLNRRRLRESPHCLARGLLWSVLLAGRMEVRTRAGTGARKLIE